MNFCIGRLWQAEQPDAVLVAWDTLSVPTYRHEAFEPYQSGRVFEESILEQLEILPEVVSAFGFLVAKAPGYEADDFLAAAAREWPGDVLVATSDRDAFQLASDRVTILQPTRGVATHPTSCREREESARRRPPSCSRNTGRSRLRSPTAASPQRRRT